MRTLTGDEILVVWGRVLLFPHYAQCLPIIPTLCSVLTYYSRIMLNAFWYLLFSKLCQHNPPNPTPKRRPAVDPKRAFTSLFHSNSRNTTAVLSSGSPWMKESPVKTATRHSLFHAHITSLFLEWKSADISVLHLLCDHR